MDCALDDTANKGERAAKARRRLLPPLPIALSLISLVYLGLAFRVAYTRSPWMDEGYMASPGYTLASKGYMGSPVISPNGTALSGELTGIQTHTYWIMPLHALIQAAWYSLFGFGILQMRSISILAGLVVTLAWFCIVRIMSGSRLAGVLAAALLSADVTFLWSAADGRMDMLATALASCGLVSYLKLRDRPRHSTYLRQFLSRGQHFYASQRHDISDAPRCADGLARPAQASMEALSFLGPVPALRGWLERLHSSATGLFPRSV